MNEPLQQRGATLDLDFARANHFPDDYDADVESAWSNPSRSQHLLSLAFILIRLDLFADGDDFSWQTIQTGRNRYYQQQLANQIEMKTTATLDLLTNALKVHLNVGQNITINTSAIFMSLETLSLSALSRRTVHQAEGAHMQLPSTMQIGTNSTSILLRVRHPSSLQSSLISPSLVGDAAVRLGWHLSLTVQHQSLAIGRTLAVRLR